MGDHQRRSGGAYEVGYGRPPKQHQFKKGRSGNPRGRPPKKPDLYAELMAVLREKVTVNVGAEPTTVTVQQALLLRLREMAVAGDATAQKLLLRIMREMPEPPPEAATRSIEEIMGDAARLAGLRVEEDAQRGDAEGERHGR